MRRKRIGIIGGGFTGAALAIHLSRNSERPLEIFIFEPRRMLGAGLAYSSSDPDHRVNGPIDILALFADNLRHFPDWFRTSGEYARDPDSLAKTGQLYCCRASFGRYMDWLTRSHAASNPSQSTIDHIECAVRELRPQNGGYGLWCEDGRWHQVDEVRLCLAHEIPELPSPFASLAGMRTLVENPWNGEALAEIASDDDILVLGTGLTAADVIASLLRIGHRGRIIAISRRGLRPREQDVLPPVEGRLAKMGRTVPLFVERHGRSRTITGILSALRKDLAAAKQSGLGWQDAFDDLRDAAPALWATLPSEARRQALRHLRGLYDVHRFRVAPPIADRIRIAEAEGRVRFVKARATAAVASRSGFKVTLQLPGDEAGREFDFAGLVNCTGPQSDLSRTRNPLLRRLFEAGTIRADPCQLGIDVDADCAVIRADGRVDPSLRVLGPLTRGHFGDLIAVPQINSQILRTV